ncbi:sigma-70 family RNA polymerase sigma factor [Nonomuraea endophytica]|uniref:RNA polymerase sigma-70 factor (ECF subfamily) n=1 Tax=Nonomuraea endophytica TaxID=714136 RepID=A0A7W8ACR2_9ACTN|nr:sigma-70 family RNA polymerase sigma factor [Nonomuraea endophytica]MBB5082686.1 RNA polymerase sigma-70 factor (ECF subfamily) [Nonomuraea endophytica]
MNDDDLLAARFETHRAQLRAVAYRMLGSLSEAEDAVQEAWFRLSRTDVSDVENLAGWLTTVTGRVCLDMLRSRESRREEPIGERLPDPIVSVGDHVDPEYEALLADSVGLALLVVLDTLAPAERLAFVLHDMFSVPFEEVATIVERSPATTRQLASRARRRVQGARVTPDPDLARQREVVAAFLSAARDGDFGALVSVLDPDVVLRVEGADVPIGTLRVVRGASEVAGQAMAFRTMADRYVPVLVNGAVGMMSAANGKPKIVAAVTVSGGKIVAMDILASPERLRRLARFMASPRTEDPTPSTCSAP